MTKLRGELTSTSTVSLRDHRGPSWLSRVLRAAFSSGKPKGSADRTYDEVMNTVDTLYHIGKIRNGFVVFYDRYDETTGRKTAAYFCKDVTEIPEVIASFTAQYALKL